MNTTRIKRTGAVIGSRAEMETIVGEVRGLTIRRLALTAEREAKLKALDERYAPELEELKESLDWKTKLLQAWAEANPEEFGKLKSIQTEHGTLGFRTGTPKLKTLSRWTWNMVLTALKDSPFWVDYIRTKDEVDKEKLIAAQGSKELSDARLKTIGVQVVQDETFFVDPKIEQIENRTAIAA